MNGEDLICRYIFSGKQSGRAILSFWRFSRHKWVVLVVMLLSVGAISLGEIYTGDTESSAAVLVFPILRDVILISLLFAFLICVKYIIAKFAFRRGVFCNTEIFFTLGEKLHIRTFASNSGVDWQIMERAAENSQGFVIIQKGGRVFFWLPKDGFKDVESFDRCRQLLRQKIKGSRLYSV